MWIKTNGNSVVQLFRVQRWFYAYEDEIKYLKLQRNSLGIAVILYLVSKLFLWLEGLF